MASGEMGRGSGIFQGYAKGFGYFESTVNMEANGENALTNASISHGTLNLSYSGQDYLNTGLSEFYRSSYQNYKETKISPDVFSNGLWSGEMTLTTYEVAKYKDLLKWAFPAEFIYTFSAPLYMPRQDVWVGEYFNWALLFIQRP